MRIRDCMFLNTTNSINSNRTNEILQIRHDIIRYNEYDTIQTNKI